MLNLVGLAAPLFLFFVAIEWAVARKRGVVVFEVGDTISNVCAGVSERLFDFFWAIVLFFAYAAVFKHAAIFHVPRGVVPWIVCLFAYDFLYYWYHRLGHEVNAFWAIHILHHHSEHYNLTVASRQSGLQMVMKSFFFAPLAIVGFDPEIAFSVFAVAGAWGFFVHTRLIDRLGPLEHFMVTPSHHRVHHGKNERYLDKNYCGVFILWDKWFGTFVPETEPVRYGITKPFRSRNVYWASLHYWFELIARARAISGWSNRVSLFFRSPAWKAPGEAEVAPSSASVGVEGTPTPVSSFRARYLLAQCLGLLVLLSALFLHRNKPSHAYTSIVAHYTEFLSGAQILTLALLALLATIVLPALAEQKRWARSAEYVRLALSVVLVPLVFGRESRGLALAFALSHVVFAVWLGREKHVGARSVASARHVGA